MQPNRKFNIDTELRWHMNDVYLSLGSNQGNKMLNLKQAMEAIHFEIGEIVSASAYYETEPWGFYTDEGFINSVIWIKTVFTASEVLERILGIEERMGRERFPNLISYSDRTIDIDILFYTNQIFKSEMLTVPHRLMHDRKFVLEPLNEIAPGLLHPVFQKTVNELLKSCRDKTMVRKAGAADAVFEVI